MTKISLSIHHNTPEVTVVDNRSLTVRKIQYHRHLDTPETSEERITCHTFTGRGQAHTSTDPRLRQSQVNNFTYQFTLSGQPLLTTGVDSGTVLLLNDAAGRPNLEINATGVTRRWQYENADSAGRPLAITEQEENTPICITERFVYAGNSEVEQSANLAGRCISHYDTAGLVKTGNVALPGVPLQVIRRLMKSFDNPAALADWQGEDTAAWDALLDTEAYTTLTTADATGVVLTTTDTKGNVQRVAYDVVGLLKGSWLLLKDGAEQVIVNSLSYSAAGQKLREVHGNGVVTTWTYKPQTQRLTGIKTERSVGHHTGPKVLQDLRYQYDPVGNVLSVHNDAEETRFWRNQKVVPENIYTYDSLYQLVSASGREMANGRQQQSHLPLFSSFDNATYTKYTRTYAYDSGGNLIQVRHSAPETKNSYTTTITVSVRSNRAVLSTLTNEPTEVDALFTAGGHQKQLLPGQTLRWTPRGELGQVSYVSRDELASDNEHYRYDAACQRVSKISTGQTGKNTQTQQTLYLAGLELRNTTSGLTTKETLHTITVGEAGRAQVRILHWEKGQPGGISNNQIRYSYDNLIGSSGLEVDTTGQIISVEEYYPYGGTAVWTGRSQTEADYKTHRYSSKERDATGLYYYGYRYYQPWAGRWLSVDPAGVIDGLNVYRMVRNNPLNSKDLVGLVSDKNLPDSILLAIGYKKGPYTEKQNELYGYSEDGQRRLTDRGWINDPRINTFSPEIFDEARHANAELLIRRERESLSQPLTIDEIAIIFLYSQESLPFHAWTANHNLGLNVPDNFKNNYSAGQTGELARALDKLPGFGGMSYRGALLHNTFYAENDIVAQRYRKENPESTIFTKGSLVTTSGFFSTSRSEQVASQFVFRQRFGNVWSPDTVLFNIIGKSGRNIADLAELQQAEILFSPGATFQVTGVTRTAFGYQVNLFEMDANKAWKAGTQIRDYQRGYASKTRPNTANYSI